MYLLSNKNLRFYPKDQKVKKVNTIVKLEDQKVELEYAVIEEGICEDEPLFTDEKINKKNVKVKRFLD